MANITMKAKDTIAAALAKCYVTIGDNRYNMCNMINLTATLEKNKTEVPILGKPGKGNKSTGWKGTGSATMHYNNSVMRQLALNYKNTGEDTYFEIEISNNDPSSAAGEQIVSLIDCNFDSLIIAKFDADGEYLDEDMDFTFEDFEIPQQFTTLEEMLA